MTAINAITSASKLTSASQTGTLDALQLAKRPDSTTKTAHHHGHHHRASPVSPAPAPPSAEAATSSQGSALDVLA